MKFKTKPYEHQADCLEQHGEKSAFALLAEMGTGKTWIIINNIAQLWLENKVDAVLVLAPNGVHTNWTRLELPKHMSCDYYCFAWSANTSKKYKLAFDIFMGTDKLRCPWSKIFTMNHEALQTKRGFDAAERFCESSEKLMIVVDESDAFKNPSAKRTKALMKLKHLSAYRRIMTGTPINNAPFDAFSQFRFLDAKILRTTSYWAFKAEYAELLPPGNPLYDSIAKNARWRPQIVQKGPGGRPKYRNLDRLSGLIAPHSFRVLKKDCLDLPDKIYKTIFFDLTREQQAAYDKMHEECRMVLDSEETPVTKLVALGKLAQITSGYYIHPLSESPVRIEGETPKLDLLIDRVQKIVDQGDKVIVWARYRIEIEDIVVRLNMAGISTVQYHGGIKKGDRTDAIDRFENGGASVFVGNQQAGGTGITLVAASYVVYFSNDFSLRNRLQSEDRAHRIGQTKNVTYINIAAKGTIDEKVIYALENKQDVADAIVNTF